MTHIISAPLRAMARVATSLANALDRPRVCEAAPPTPADKAPQERTLARELEELLRSLRHRKRENRVRAAQRLGELRLQATAPHLVRAAQDDPEVRRAALAALCRIDPDLFAETVVSLAQSVSQTELFADLDDVAGAASAPAAHAWPSSVGVTCDGAH